MAGERRPGRPKGDGTNDDKELAAMADLILAKPGLRPTTTYKRVVHRPAEAAIRRIQAKWRARREELLAAASDRRDRARERTVTGPSVARTARFESATETAARRMDEMLGFRSGLGRELAAMQALRDAVDPPALREIRRIMDNPLAKAMRSLDETTGVRAMREALGIWDAPTMRAAMGLEASAVARAAGAGQGDARLDGALTAHRGAANSIIAWLSVARCLHISARQGVRDEPAAHDDVRRRADAREAARASGGR